MYIICGSDETHYPSVMAEEIPVTQARDELAELINRVAYGHERIILTRHGKLVAGLVPAEDLAWLEQRSRETITLTSASDGFQMQQPPAATEVLPIAAKHAQGPSAPPQPPGRG